MEDRTTRERYKRLVKLAFGAVMLLGLCLLYAVVWIGYYNEHILQSPFYRRGNWVMILIYGILLAFFMNTYGGFKIGYLKNGNLIYSQIISVLFTNVLTYLQIAVIDRRFVNPIYIMLMTLGEILFIVVWTLLFQMAYRQLFPPRKMIFIQGDRRDYHLMDKMNSREDKYEICKILSYKEGIDKIKGLIKDYDAVLIGDMPSHERNLLLKYCFSLGIRSYSVPKISDVLLRSSDELNLFDTPLLLSRNIGLTVEQQWVKRLEDVVFSVLMLILFSPVFLIAAVGIKCTDGGPVFYKQKRLTKDGKIFEIYKFRTMVDDAERKGSLVTAEGDSRITRVGKKLRGCRLDELPQLINIWKGEMSFVGTRPEVAKYVRQYRPDMYATLLLPAGVTSEASIRFKDEDRFFKEGQDVDAIYVNKVLPMKMAWNLKALWRYSLPREIWTMAETVLAVLRED